MPRQTAELMKAIIDSFQYNDENRGYCKCFGDKTGTLITLLGEDKAMKFITALHDIYD